MVITASQQPESGRIVYDDDVDDVDDDDVDDDECFYIGLFSAV